MSNVIKLLPDAVANQIAAGEVIQRPASAVKELMENAVDAGATEISLVLKDAGKTLIQVIDNGCGMSAIDARMSFERHATSKISSADDLFAIKTMGFRGEALASIAAIAHVEMKTRPKEDELGTCLRIEGSKLIGQEPCSCKEGTSIAVKNLFFNVPARRNFLKSDTTETRHTIEEFTRVALINPDITFSMYHNNKLVYKLNRGSFKKRIVDIFGKVYEERLLPVEQETDIVRISGFILKAEFAKKTRGEQYFFVNKRFVKHAYLNHAVTSAFSRLLPADTFPSYFLHIELDPADIDINIHPTKTEVNFKDSKYIYSVVHASVRESVGKFNLAPTLNFDEDRSLNTAFHSRPSEHLEPPGITVNPDYNPFDQKPKSTAGFPGSTGSFGRKSDGDKNWEELYRHFENNDREPQSRQTETFSDKTDEQKEEVTRFFQVHKRYIACNVRSGLMFIDQQKAHERILFETYLEQLSGQNRPSQQQLFPKEIHFSATDMQVVEELRPELEKLGFLFKIEENTMVVTGIPADFSDGNINAAVEAIVEDAKKALTEPGAGKQIRLAQTMAAQLAVKQGTALTEEEMAELFDKLFACRVPETAPDGKKIIAILRLSDLEEFLR